MACAEPSGCCLRNGGKVLPLSSRSLWTAAARQPSRAPENTGKESALGTEQAEKD